MKKEKYLVSTNPNRKKEKYVTNTEKGFTASISKIYTDATASYYQYCVFPLYDETDNMIMDEDFEPWAASKGIQIKDFEEMVQWYLLEYLNKKSLNYTLMVGDRRYGNLYEEINFIEEVYNFSTN